jgi:hypothetical protein
MAEFLIIPEEIARKLKDTRFDGYNVLYPMKGELESKEVYFLQAELKENKIFTKALDDFKVCEIKEIKSIEPGMTIEEKIFIERDYSVLSVKDKSAFDALVEKLQTAKTILKL